MRFWANWHKVLDPMNSSEDWFWVNSIMGTAGPERWVYLENSYYFKHERDATLFRLMWY